MPTQTIDMNNVTSVSFNNQAVNEIKFNGNTIWPPIRNTYIYFDDDYSSQFTLTTANGTKNWDGTIETSTDGTTWTVWDGTTGVTSSASGMLYVRGKNNTYITRNNSNGWVFTNAHLIAIGGNIESLLDNEVVGAGNHPVMANYAFAGLFKNAPIFLIPETFLPATTLSDYCYYQTFMGTNLLIAPALPATTLKNYCYNAMFMNCTSLSDIDDLHLNATKLANCCYLRMFQGCTSLTTAPSLPATTLFKQCYLSMFQGCTSLTTAPSLPATTLAEECYSQMFMNCTSLINLPAIPATTLGVKSCYQMFTGCTNLETLPALKSITLTDKCYSSMFYGCTKIKLSTTQNSTYVNAYRIPTTGTGTATSNSLNSMFTNTGGTFRNAPTINTTYYTSNTIVS